MVISIYTAFTLPTVLEKSEGKGLKSKYALIKVS